MKQFNYSIKKNLILFIALQPERVMACRNGIIIMSHGHKVVVKFNSTTHLCSIGIMHHFHMKERIVKDVPLNRVVEVIYREIGKHPMWFKYLAAWL